MRAIQILPGDVFARLTVVEELPRMRLPSGQTKRNFSFICACGNTTTALLDNVRRGKILSCGCLNAENKAKHGLAAHPLASVWYGMHERCRNREGYSGRGIKVCDEWSGETGLAAFIGWAEALEFQSGWEVDRSDNNGDYTPLNCRLVTRSVNQRNKRDALKVDHPITGDSTSLITLWETEGNPSVPWPTVRCRYLYLNWGVADAISIPLRGTNDH